MAEQVACAYCEGRGEIEPGWPIGPGGAHLSPYKCSNCGGTGIVPISRPVMNPPADEAEAGNRVQAAPPQVDSDAGRRGMAGPLTESEARPVMPTEHRLKVIEPLRMHGYTLAEVFVSHIGLAPSLAMTFDTEDGGEATVTLTAREATDLMLWLQCALNEPCEHEWEIVDEGGGSSEFQPPDPAVRQCCLCGARESS